MSTRGSEWRKWDVHVHTSASIVHDYAKGSYAEVWDRYFVELEKMLSLSPRITLLYIRLINYNLNHKDN